MFIIIAWPISLLTLGVLVYVFTEGSAYQRGYKSGYETGEIAGHKSGQDSGILAGYKSGDSDGYKRGLSDGEANGRALQSLHRETVSTLSAQSVQKAPRKFHKRAAQGKKPNGNVKGRSRAS